MVAELERRHRASTARYLAEPWPERPALHRQSGDLDGGHVRDSHDLVTWMGKPHGLDRPNHSCRDATIGLPPARAERVEEVPEVTRLEEHPTVCVLSLQVALGLDDVLAGVHVQPPGTGDRPGCFLRPDQGTGVDRRQGMGSEELAECLGSLPAPGREG